MNTPLEPAARVRPDARGTPVMINGAAWLFADYIPAFDRVWDELYDRNLLAGRYDETLVLMAAIRLLVEANDVTPAEAAELIAAVPAEDLVPAVEAGLIGAESDYRSYSDWVISALYANGLDPDRIPAARVRDVMEQLVATGRASPASEFISSAAASKARRGLLQLMKPA